MQPSSTLSSEAYEAVRRNMRLVALCETAREFHSAWCKSAEIMARSTRVWNAALFGLSWMTLEDAINAARVRLSCRTLGSLMELERDLAPRLVADAFDRFLRLMTISSQIGEEAGYPLRCWLVLKLQKLAPAALA
jgi:hypothetical protein